MKAIITINISTEADLANGMRGIISDIILNHREQLDWSEIKNGIVTLLYPPAMIIFKPDKSSFPRFEGLKQGEIPLFPSEHNFRISTYGKKVNFHHREYTLTPRYAFTLNKGKGQTLPFVLVNI